MKTTIDLVNAYYDCWKRGGTPDEARLRTILAPDLTFEGPMRTAQSLDAFLPGLVRFATHVDAFRELQTLTSGSQASVLYDCDASTPAGTFRFAEFFRVEGAYIRSIRLVFDTTKFR